MQLEGKVGAISVSSGSVNTVRTNTEGAMVVAPGAAGKYGDLVLADKVFSATNTAAVALSAALSTTHTGLLIENPATSGKNYIMLSVSWFQTVATPSAGGLGLLTGVDAGTAASSIVARNRKIGSSVLSDAIVDFGSTLTGTPVREMLFSTNWSEATSAGSQQPIAYIDLNGQIVLEPGSYVGTYAAVAESAAFWFTFTWAEFNV